jgi:ribonuclease Z
MPSHNLARIEMDGLEIIGYSFAGEETVVAMPQLDVCFDIGKAPDQVIAVNNVLLTHGHMDHAAGIAYYLSHRNFCDLPAGTILAPENLIGPIRRILEGWTRLDGNKVPANLVGVKPGHEHQVKTNLFAKVFPTKHSRGSVGYCVLERRKKLKQDYAGLNGPQLVELKKQGVEIEYRLDVPIVTYLGDTQYVDFSGLDYIAASKILIAECTFYIDEHEGRADAGRHMHIKEFSKMLEALDNEHIVITHTTQRTPLREVRKILRDCLPANVFEKSVLLMDRKRGT